MQELKETFITQEMNTPQCTGAPDHDPPESLRPYFQSLSFGLVRVCEWHSKALSRNEEKYLRVLQIAFGNGLEGGQKAFLQVRCWG